MHFGKIASTRGHYVLCQATGQTRIVFSVAKRLENGHKMKMLGNVKTLGEWEPNNAVTLEKIPKLECHFAEVNVDAGQRLEYKFFSMSSDDGPMLWQPADKFIIDIPQGTEGAECFITDTWKGGKRIVSWEGLMRPLKQSAIDGNGSDSSNGAIEPPVLEANALEASEQEFNYTHNNGARETDSASRDSNGQEAKEPEPHTLNGEALSGKLQHKSNVRSKNGTVRASKEQVKEPQPSLASMTVRELRGILRNLGISPKRKKADMIEEIVHNKNQE